MSQFTDGNAEGYRQVPRLSRVPVLTKITLKSLAILTGNLTGTLRGAQVHVPRYQLNYQLYIETRRLSLAQ